MAKFTIDLVPKLLFVVIHMHKVPLAGLNLKEIERDHDSLLIATQEEHIAVLVKPELERRMLTVQIHRDQVCIRLEIATLARSMTQLIGTRESS